eukprot:967156-Pleurochrysis_carterae.AAC.2
MRASERGRGTGKQAQTSGELDKATHECSRPRHARRPARLTGDVAPAGGGTAICTQRPTGKTEIHMGIFPIYELVRDGRASH